MKTTIKLLVLSLVLLASTAFAETIVIPSVVHAPGANGSFWKTAIGVYNSSTVVQTISARNILTVGDVPTVDVQPGQFVGTDDLGAMFNAGDGTFLVELTRTDPSVLFTARTYSVTEGQPGQFSTLLLPVHTVTQPISLVFSRVEGARKALFFYGDLHASCYTATGDAVYVYFGTPGVLTRQAIPNDTLVCNVTAEITGFPSGGDPSDYNVYAWASEADDVSNCPTLITAEQP